MLDTFSKDIVYKELPPPYTQTLFIELIRFIPGQPDTVLTNGGPSHPSGSSSHSSHALNGNAYNPRAVPHPTPRATPHSFSPPHQINTPGAHMPPPPPWEVKWRRPVSTSAPPPPAPVTAISVPSPSASSSSVRRLSTSSSVTPLPAPAVVPGGDDKRLPAVAPMTPPSASRKRKYPEGDAAVSSSSAAAAAAGHASPYGSPSCKRHTPAAEPPPPLATTTTTATASSSSSSSSPTPASGHRATQTLSPSLAMIMSPDTRLAPFVGSSSASLPATPPQQRKVKLTYTNGEGTPR